MSKPMHGESVSADVVSAYPTTPPAGPDRIALYQGLSLVHFSAQLEPFL